VKGLIKENERSKDFLIYVLKIKEKAGDRVIEQKIEQFLKEMDKEFVENEGESTENENNEESENEEDEDNNSSDPSNSGN
jgi:hypothetical protein